MLKAKHQQLFDILKEKFLRGEYPCGEKLPRMTVLAEQYSVSINIASKAVDLLKEAGMVEAKVGDGIYSTFKAPASINSFHYAGDRVYGHYRGAKPLRILVEDSAPYQITFWDHFFQKFSSENPDIEIDANYHSWNDRKEQQSYEAAIGGCEFLQHAVPAEDKGLSAEWVRRFVPGLYQDCLYGESDFAGRLPYGFSAQKLFAAPGTPEPKPGENVFEYLERLPDSSKGCLIRSSRLLLAGMGVDMAKIGTDSFSAADADAMLSVFQRAKKLYDSGKLLWPHGKITDSEQMFDLLKNGGIQAMEIQSNNHRMFPEDKKIRLLPYPYGKNPCITLHYMHISENTLYPEEYLRLLKALLSREVQKRAEKEQIFDSIRRDVSAGADSLREAIAANRVQLPHANPLSHTDAFYNFLGWEFYYYLEGRRGAEVIDLIHQKIRYFYEHKK